MNEYKYSDIKSYIYSNDYMHLDESLTLIAENSALTNEGFERFLIDMIIEVENSSTLNWFEKSGLFSVFLKHLSSCSKEALSIAKIHMIDHIVTPEHVCSTSDKAAVDSYTDEHSFNILSERADALKLFYATIHKFKEKFTNTLIRPADISCYFNHMSVLDSNWAAMDWNELAQVYKDTQNLNEHDRLFHDLIFNDIPLQFSNNLKDDDFIDIAHEYPAICQAVSNLRPDCILELINNKLCRNLLDDEELGDYLEIIFQDKLDREKFNSYFNEYENKDGLHIKVYQPALRTVIQFPALDGTVLASMGLNVTTDEFYQLYIDKLSTEDPSITFSFDDREDLDEYMNSLSDFIEAFNNGEDDDDDDFFDDDFDFDDDDDDNFALDDYDDIWAENDFRHGNYNSIGRGDYWDSNGIHWDENDNILD